MITLSQRRVNDLEIYKKSSVAFAEHVCSTSKHVGNVENFFENPWSVDSIHTEPKLKLQIAKMLKLFAEVEFVSAVSAGGSVKFLPSV